MPRSLRYFCIRKSEQYKLSFVKINDTGPLYFYLEASKEVPKRLRHAKRKTIGLRVPENNIAHDLLAQLGEPLMSSTLILPNDDMPLTDPYEMRDALSHQVDLIIDGGYCGFEPTTVIDLMDDVPQVIRQGRGDASVFTH